MTFYNFSSLVLILCLVVAVQCLSTLTQKADPNDNRGNTPFFLQDPLDQSCLGPNGFTFCDESTLWILTKRPGYKTYSMVSFTSPSKTGLCLQRSAGFMGMFGSNKVIVGPCSKSSAKTWDFEFENKAYVKLSNKKQCLVRGKKGLKNSISLQSCDKGEYIPLIYHATAVHENGFLMKASDYSCFDGTKFRTCGGMGQKMLLWGQGVKYVRGNAQKYYFLHGDVATCLTVKGNKPEKGPCDSASTALGWDLINGQLARGGRCLGRLADDSAVMVACSEGHEPITMEIPSVETAGATVTEGSAAVGGSSTAKNGKSKKLNSKAKAKI